LESGDIRETVLQHHDIVPKMSPRSCILTLDRYIGFWSS